MPLRINNYEFMPFFKFQTNCQLLQLSRFRTILNYHDYLSLINVSLRYIFEFVKF